MHILILISKYPSGSIFRIATRMSQALLWNLESLAACSGLASCGRARFLYDAGRKEPATLGQFRPLCLF